MRGPFSFHKPAQYCFLVQAEHPAFAFWILVQFGRFALKTVGQNKPKETQAAGRPWWESMMRCGGDGESGSKGSINHFSCCFLLTLRSHWATTVNVLSGTLRESMKERAWLNAYLCVCSSL